MYAFDFLLINFMQCTCLQCLHGGKIPLKVDAVDVDFRQRAFIVNSQILPKIRFFFKLFNFTCTCNSKVLCKTQTFVNFKYIISEQKKNYLFRYTIYLHVFFLLINNDHTRMKRFKDSAKYCGMNRIQREQMNSQLEWHDFAGVIITLCIFL